jgi:hypothetical protein
VLSCVVAVVAAPSIFAPPAFSIHLAKSSFNFVLFFASFCAAFAAFSMSF